jgi:hypothetical protein
MSTSWYRTNITNDVIFVHDRRGTPGGAEATGMDTGRPRAAAGGLAGLRLPPRARSAFRAAGDGSKGGAASGCTGHRPAAPVNVGSLGRRCGFVLAEYYGLVRATGDVDVLESAGTDKATIARLAGRGSPLHKRHRVYIDIVTVADVARRLRHPAGYDGHRGAHAACSPVVSLPAITQLPRSRARIAAPSRSRAHRQ